MRQILIFLFLTISIEAFSQSETLQSVTDRGDTTIRDIKINGVLIGRGSTNDRTNTFVGNFPPKKESTEAQIREVITTQHGEYYDWGDLVVFSGTLLPGGEYPKACVVFDEWDMWGERALIQIIDKGHGYTKDLKVSVISEWGYGWNGYCIYNEGLKSIGNTALGFQTLFNVKANNNTAAGFKSLYSNGFGESNTAIGSMSLSYNTSGNHNTAVGMNSLGNLKYGFGNTAIGSLSGNNSTGDYNSYFGYGAGSAVKNGSANTIIGANVSLPDGTSEAVVIADGYGKERIYSPKSGNILIGYSNYFNDEGFRLDVNGAARFQGRVQGANAAEPMDFVTKGQLEELNSQGNYLKLAVNSNSPTSSFFAIGNSEGRNFIQSHAGYPLDINPLGNNVSVNANVGIGTQTPNNRLQIVGEHHSTNMNLHYSNPDPKNQADLTLWASEPGLTWNGAGIGNNVYNSASGGITRISGSKGGSYIRLLDQGLKLNVVSTQGVDISAVTIGSTGYVGIGTNVPTEMLSVNGNIVTKGVKVNPEGLPDYVFKHDYNLRPLSDVERFIRTNSHLPEVPSAEDVKKDGLELGEMSKTLLKKVEELTLYLIEMKKENQALKSEIIEIKKRLVDKRTDF